MTDSGGSTGQLLQLSEMASSPQYMFDPPSETIISSLPSAHKSHVHVAKSIRDAANVVASATEHGRSVSRNGLNYDQLLAGLLYNEERMLVGQYLYFDYVVFNPEEGSPVRSNLTQGRAFLTDHRLLLLSAEEYQGLSLTTLAPGLDKKPSGYVITGKASDVAHYLSVPLASIRSVELHASVGVEGSVSVFGVRPCALLAALSCFGMDTCLKRWSVPPSTVATASNKRTLTLGVTLPPWDYRYMIDLHLNYGVPLPLVKDYIVALSRFSPSIITKAQPAAF